MTTCSGRDDAVELRFVWRWLTPQAQERGFRRVAQHTNQQTQLAGVIAPQKLKEASLHLLIEGAMNLEEFSSERCQAKQDFLPVVGQRFETDQLSDDQPPRDLRDRALWNPKLRRDRSAVHRLQASDSVNDAQAHCGRIPQDFHHLRIVALSRQPLPLLMLF